MGLLDTIKAGVNTAFSVVDDLLSTVDYYSFEGSDYDADTGTPTTRYVSYSNVKILIEDYSRREVDGENIQSQDKKVSIPADNLAVNPKPKDKFFESTGQEWRVVDYDPSTDPAKAMHVLQCRRVI